ncbi:MmgE/PrpD family protein [Besnoitia besnoiti]|uniref:MmgE/PrpD family protein n=1 Tax=Besnoitia besnoiti TaxID=94643 RepID=A0A2A9MGU7_BESBE|nr:MmgE/PrpD family protein [Besnoitia besnoiti]PFH34650.1 MmgE/PrpD family protein [Besnoitia besnoiti]
MPSQAGFGAGEAEYAVLPRNSNQALGIAQYAIDFLGGKYGDNVSARVYERVRLFHTDSVVCGVSALALKTNAPTILREEALEYSCDSGARVFGSLARSHPEKAIAANCAAVREWDANGTVFGFNPKLPEHRAGEFGHNDFYPVVVAAAHAGAKDVDGRKALRAMLCLDEIRGRLAEVFSLKSFKVDHVVHGAIASAAVYGALLGATAEQIESAIGLSVAHYIPWRAIRAGKQLSDSKGSSAGLAAEAAVLSMRRAMRGFVGPRDIFRNPESVFRANVRTAGDSPFDLILAHSGEDFAVARMHFKLGLYEHQSAGALEGVLRLLMENPVLYKEPSRIKSVTVTAYEPAFGVIGDVAKRDPQTRQSADHSMVYVISTLMRKAIEAEEIPPDLDGAWMALMLTPFDYSKEAIAHPTTRALMNNTHFKHGGPEYDAKYPEGIPTSVAVELSDGQTLEGPLVMFPAGHAANTEADLMKILSHKFRTMVAIAMEREDAEAFLAKLDNLPALSNEELQTLYYFPSLKSLAPID